MGLLVLFVLTPVLLRRFALFLEVFVQSMTTLDLTRSKFARSDMRFVKMVGSLVLAMVSFVFI